MILPMEQILVIFSILGGFALSIPLAEALGVGGRASKYLALAALLASLFTVLAQPPSSSPHAVSGFLMGTDPVSYPLTLAILIGALVGIASLPLSANDSAHAYLSSSLLGVLGSIMLLHAQISSPIAVISSWTLLSISTFAVIALARDRDSLEASVRYSIVGSVASQLIIIGAALAAFYTEHPAAQGQAAVIGAASAALLSIAVGFKLGLAPAHTWVPDVYGSAAPYVVSILSGSLKLGVIGFAVRILSSMGSSGINIFPVVAAMSLSSMVVGSVTPLTQSNAQRILAFSSIAHMGFIFIGVSVIAAAPQDPGSVKLALLGIAMQTIAYSIAKSGAFAALNYMKSLAGGLYLDTIKGLGSKDPRISLSLTIHMLNLVGVPPLPGFWGKLFLFMAASQSIGGLYAGQVPWLALAGIIASVISVYYYLNILRPVIMAQPQGPGDSKPPVPRDSPDLWASYASAVATVALGLVIYGLSYILWP